MSEPVKYKLSETELEKYRRMDIKPYPKPCIMPPDICELMAVKREIKQREPEQREPQQLEPKQQEVVPPKIPPNVPPKIPPKPCLRCGNMIPQDKNTTVYSYAQRKYCGAKCAGFGTGIAKIGKPNKRVNTPERSTMPYNRN